MALSLDLTPAVLLQPAASTRNVIQPTGAAIIPFTLKGAAAQTADLLQFQDSTAAILTRFDSAGRLQFGADVILQRDAANVLGIRNGANATGLTVYRDYTDASNYSRGLFSCTGGFVQISAEAAGSGTPQAIRVISKGGIELQTYNIGPQEINFNIDGGNRWRFLSTALLLATDNALDIGASGANRPRSLYVGTSAIVPLLQLGGLTAAFGALQNLTTTGGWGVRLPSGADTNGQSLNIQSLTESTTIAAAATTDTVIQIPAGAIVVGVSVRVTTVIPTAATFTYGVAGATARYGTGISTAAGATYPGTDDGTRFYAAAVSIRFTPNLTPAAATGVVRTTIHYLSVSPPTS